MPGIPRDGGCLLRAHPNSSALLQVLAQLFYLSQPAYASPWLPQNNCSNRIFSNGTYTCLYFRGEESKNIPGVPPASAVTVYFHKSVELQREKVLFGGSLSAGCPQRLCHRPLPESPSVSVKLRLAKADDWALGRTVWKESSFWFTSHRDMFQKTSPAFVSTASLCRCLLCLLGPVLDQKALALPSLYIMSSAHYKRQRVLRERSDYQPPQLPQTLVQQG